MWICEEYFLNSDFLTIFKAIQHIRVNTWNHLLCPRGSDK